MSRPPTQIMHTAEVVRAIAVAERRWLREKPGALLLRLITDRASALERCKAAANEPRRRAREEAETVALPFWPAVRDGWPAA